MMVPLLVRREETKAIPRQLSRYPTCASSHGEKLTGHGFRHMMSTILHEKGFNSAWIELQLAHADKNTIRGTYNRAQYLEGRKEMMQWYADHIDSRKESLR